MKQLTKIIDQQILFHSVPKPGSDETSKREQVRRARIAASMSIITGLFFILLWILSVALNLPAKFMYLLLPAGLVTLSSIWIIRAKGYQSYRAPSALIITLMLILIPLRIYYSGGIYSSVNIYTAISVMAAGLFFGKKGILGTTVFWWIAIWFFYQQQSAGAISPADPNILPLATISVLLGFCVVGGVVYLFVKTQSYFQDKIAHSEHNVTRKLFTAALSHEITNPLFIADLTVEKCIHSKKIEQKDLDKLKQAYSRVSEVLAGIKELEEGDGKFETVPYAESTDMAKIPRTNS